jgi:hypothetical protein
MLYGQAYVNGIEIIDWAARRIEDPPQEVNEYEISVRFTDRTGYIHNVEGNLRHTFTDGALVLISKIMEWAAEHIEAAKNERTEDAYLRHP